MWQQTLLIYLSKYLRRRREDRVRDADVHTQTYTMTEREGERWVGR